MTTKYVMDLGKLLLVKYQISYCKQHILAEACSIAYSVVQI